MQFKQLIKFLLCLTLFTGFAQASEPTNPNHQNSATPDAKQQAEQAAQEVKQQQEEAQLKSDGEFFRKFIVAHSIDLQFVINTYDNPLYDPPLLCGYINILKNKAWYSQKEHENFLKIYKSNPALYKDHLLSQTHGTLLMFGLRIKSKTIIEYALTLKDEFTYVNPLTGNTALHVAAYNGNRTILEHLLPFIDIETPNKEGRTPLMFAAGGNNCECAQTLLQHNANIHACDYEGNTVLHYAAHVTDNEEVVNLLLKHKADTKQKNKNARSPIEERPAYLELENVISEQIRTCMHSSKDNMSATNLLYLAVQCDDIDEIITALNNEADINFQDDKGNTILHEAIRLQNSPAVQKLLGFGPDMAIANNDGQMPLQLAEHLAKKYAHDRHRCKNAKLIRRLVCKKLGTTQPTIPTKKNIEKVLKKPLKIDVDATSSENAPVMVPSPLASADQKDQTEQDDRYYSASYYQDDLESLPVDTQVSTTQSSRLVTINNPQAVRVLLDGITKQEYFKEFIRLYMLNLETLSDEEIGLHYLSLLQKRAQYSDEEFLKIYKSDPHIYKSLLPFKNLFMFGLCINSPKIIEYALTLKELDEVNYDGATALHFVARYGTSIMLDNLRKRELHKISLEARDNQGRTPLMWAVMGNNSACIGALWLADADVANIDNNGNTAYHYAAMINSPCISFFTGHFMKQPKNKQGQTPQEMERFFIEQEAERTKHIKFVLDRYKKEAHPDHLLYMAIQLNLPEYISFALHRGANINVQDDKGNTPLHEAVRLVNLPAVKLLLDCGANIMITNKSGETPSDILNKFIKGDHSNNRTNSNLTKACFIKELFDEARQRTKQSNADKKDGI